jgi:hypothetical protein
MPATVRSRVGDEFLDFSKEIGRSPNELIEEFSDAIWLIDEPFKGRIREGEDLKQVLLELFDLAKIGHYIDKYVRGALELGSRDFVMVDCDISLEDDHYFFAYEATGNSKGKVDNVYLVLDRGSVELVCSRYIEDKKLLSKLKKVSGNLDAYSDKLEHLEIFSELMDCDHEFEASDDEEPPYTFSLTIDEEDIEYLPSIPHISELFKKLDEVALNAS